MTLAELRREWRHLVGARVADLTNPSHVEAHVLVVTVPASIFTAQLEEESAAIVDRLGLVDGVEIVAIEWRQVAPVQTPRRSPWWIGREVAADD